MWRTTLTKRRGSPPSPQRPPSSRFLRRDTPSNAKKRPKRPLLHPVLHLAWTQTTCKPEELMQLLGKEHGIRMAMGMVIGMGARVGKRSIWGTDWGMVTNVEWRGGWLDGVGIHSENKWRRGRGWGFLQQEGQRPGSGCSAAPQTSNPRNPQTIQLHGVGYVRGRKRHQDLQGRFCSVKTVGCLVSIILESGAGAFLPRWWCSIDMAADHNLQLCAHVLSKPRMCKGGGKGCFFWGGVVEGF